MRPKAARLRAPPLPPLRMFLAASLMPKYWGKQIFAHGRFPEVGQKQKTEKKKKKRERAKVGDNNGQATHGARKPPGPKIS